MSSVGFCKCKLCNVPVSASELAAGNSELQLCIVCLAGLRARASMQRDAERSARRNFRRASAPTMLALAVAS